MIKLRTACFVATMIVVTTTFASAQGGSTDRNGNAIGSEHVGNGGGTMGGMSGPATGTTGMNTRRSQRDSPNGSPGAPPKAHGGPAPGDSSQKEIGTALTRRAEEKMLALRGRPGSLPINIDPEWCRDCLIEGSSLGLGA